MGPGAPPKLQVQVPQAGTERVRHMHRITPGCDAFRTGLLASEPRPRNARFIPKSFFSSWCPSVGWRIMSAMVVLWPVGAFAVQDEATTDAEYVLVEGQITDQMGAALSGVIIEAHPSGREGDSAAPLATAESDAMGDFVLTAPKPFRGKITLTFTKPMFATLTREVEVGGEEVPYLGDSLHGDLTVVGRVLHAITESPIVGAAIEASTYGETWTATSDAEGRFDLKGVSPGSGEVTVSAKGFGREREVIRRFVDAGELLFRLKPERLIHVRVTDDSGKPVKGVMVEAFDPPRDDMRTFVTDDKGLVTVDAVHFDAETLQLRLTHDDFVSDTDFSRELLLPKEQTVSTHELRIQRAGEVTGQVTDAVSGQPVHSARVMTGDTFTDNSPRDWTSPRGTYTITGVEPGPVVLTVHAPGYAPELRTVTVAPGKKASADFKLSQGVAVSGFVKDANGDPVQGVSLATSTWRKSTTLGLHAISDTKGVFVMEDAPRDRFEIIATPKIGEPITRTVRGASSDRVTFTFPVEPVRSGPIGTEGLKVGDVAPSIEITAVDGTVINTADHKGKVVLLDFWATWCAPCVDEMPQLVAVWEKYRSHNDFVMLGLSRDFDAASLQGFLRKHADITWPQAVGMAGGVEKAAQLFGVTWIPRVYLMDRSGKIVGKNLRGEGVMREVDKLFGDKDPS